MELLSAEYRLSKELRLPAISRLQKIHNTQLVFDELARKNIEVESTKGISIWCIFNDKEIYWETLLFKQSKFE